jgi:hypothetical protein
MSNENENNTSVSQEKTVILKGLKEGTFTASASTALKDFPNIPNLSEGYTLRNQEGHLVSWHKPLSETTTEVHVTEAIGGG